MQNREKRNREIQAKKKNPFLCLENFFAYFVTGLFLLAITFGVFTEIILRKVFDTSLYGLEEFVCMAMINITFFPMAGIQRVGEHVSMDLVINALRPRFKYATEIISLVLSLAIFAVATYSGIVYVAKLYNEGSITVLRGWPLWPYYISFPLGCTLLWIRILIQLIHNVKNKLNCTNSNG
jgi:TRAP-type C4-dicarboxylate transport system permease small subunit